MYKDFNYLTKFSKNEKENKYNQFLEKLAALFLRTKTILIIKDHELVSGLLQKLRKKLHRKCIIVMGKTKWIKKGILKASKTDPDLLKLLEFVNHSVGLGFVLKEKKEFLDQIQEIFQSVYLMKAAVMGKTCKNDIVIRKGITNLFPTQTSYISTLNIPTRISRSRVEVLCDVTICKKGETIPIYADLFCRNLKYKPCEYHQGFIYNPENLFKSDTYLKNTILENFQDIVNISNELGFRIQQTLKTPIYNSIKTIFSISVSLGFPIKETQLICEELEERKTFNKLWVDYRIGPKKD
ncbi:60S ACIDIC ribosomal protein P0 [Anaeramoeba flamelloides]|uniref:60S ACIDIC ribosomal protein P0 n=1 Tax=Anaeramoeba flamelloides TaxID=1746091 RepID=A0AAV7Z536_9EUKA|nr:60S ACIDIC ribosomal protein P0 [Anaeramoeba flamelloides]